MSLPTLASPNYWARMVDYLIGRNALIGWASFMLVVISGYATWHGMHDFIVGASSSQQTSGPAGMSVSNSVLVITIVVALTFLMWLCLRESFGAQRTITERLITFPLYVFLALWSIGFGYGFWWSLIAGEEATRSGMSGLVEDARDAGNAISARLDAVRIQLDNVVTWSEGQMSREENTGGSCGTGSGAGRGPLYNARRSVRDSITTLRDGVVNSWLGPVRTDLEQLQRAALSLDAGGTVEERQKRFETAAAEIRGRARSLAARSNELGNSTAGEMRALADTVSIPPGQQGFSCYDPTLAQRLRQAAQQASQPADLKLRDAQFNEGPAGVANAIKNLWANIGSYMTSLLGFIFTGGQWTGSTSTGNPISGRDLIALLATIGIDLGLLALSVLNPPSSGPVRHDGLAATQSRLHLPTATVIRHLEDAIGTAIKRAPGTDLEWVRLHFLHHAGASYFVIPNLYSCAEDKDEEKRALAVNQLAGIFSDLKLIRALTAPELQKFGQEEVRDSYSDLTVYRKKRKEAQGESAQAQSSKHANEKIERNHGLLSKAERALDIAGWSKEAKEDTEIFRVVDTDGLTPLLWVLSKDKERSVDSGDAEAQDKLAPPGREPPRQLPPPQV